jgi:hypothetical protein
MFERHYEPLLPFHDFIVRLVRHSLLATIVIAIALGIGILGYHYLEGLSVLDSFLNASMILGGMGEIDILHSPAAKLFAGFYALFAGLVFVGVVGIIILPIAHRFLHLLHLHEKQGKEQK